MSSSPEFVRPEAFPELCTFAEVARFLDDPVQRQRILGAVALEMYAIARDLLTPDASSDAPRCHKLQPQAFAQLFDPNLPTIVFDANRGPEGIPLLGVAAAERAAQGRGVANVLFISASTDCAFIETTVDGARLVVSHAALFDAAGEVYVGELPNPVVADLFDIASPSVMRQCAQAGVATASHAMTFNKHNSVEMIAAAGLDTPQRYHLDEIWQEEADAAYVMKPSNCSAWRGVRMFQGSACAQEARDYFAFLQAGGYEPVIEECIWPTPLQIYQGDRKTEIGWYARVLVLGNVIDAYIRVGTPGDAIIIDADKCEVLIDNLDQITGSAARSEQILNDVLGVVDQLSRYLQGHGLLGVDVTVDRTQKKIIFEINGNDVNIGGLNVIARLELQRAHKLLNLQYVLDALVPSATTDRTASRVVASEPIVRDIVSYAIGMWRTGHRSGLVGISEAEVAANHPTHWEYRLWLVHCYNAAALLEDHQDRLDNFREVDERFMRLAPIEWPGALLEVEIPYIHPDPAGLLEKARYYQKVVPCHEWNKVCAQLEDRLFFK